MAQTFEFDFEPPFRPLLLAFGATPRSSYVTVQGGSLEARFGFVRLATDIGNVVEAKETGPYRWWRAIGVRSSLADGGITFGSSTRGVCIRFRDPVPVRPDFARGRPALTVTVVDRAGLVAAIEAARR